MEQQDEAPAASQHPAPPQTPTRAPASQPDSPPPAPIKKTHSQRQRERRRRLQRKQRFLLPAASAPPWRTAAAQDPLLVGRSRQLLGEAEEWAAWPTRAGSYQAFPGWQQSPSHKPRSWFYEQEF